MARRPHGAAITRRQPRAPKIVVLAGPNGAGKSTSADDLLRGNFRVRDFVNADEIARALSADKPNVDVAAGREMVRQIRALAHRRATFAFETTLASRSFAPWIRGLIAEGYEFGLVFLWLPTAEMAIQRVQERVRRGGHSVPEATVRRRYHAGIRNFFNLYQPLAKTWQMIDNSGRVPRLIATGSGRRASIVREGLVWRKIKRRVRR